MNNAPMQIRRNNRKGAAIIRRAFSRRRCEYSRAFFARFSRATNFQRRAFFPAALCVAAFFPIGCNQAPSNGSARVADTTRGNINNETRDANAKSATRLSPQNNASTRAASDSNSSGADASAPIFINVARLARRHPAWILADALERDQLSAPLPTGASTRAIPVTRPLPPRRANGMAIPALPILRSVALPRRNDSFSNAASDSAATPQRASTRGGDNPLLPPPANTSATIYPARAATFSRDFGTLLDAMANRQSVALARFFSVSQQRGAARREELRGDLLNALNDDIAADTDFQELQDTVPPAFLPPPATQLEMTNLRLQLVKNARTSKSEREAAAARLEELESAWRRHAENSLDAWMTARETVSTERPRELKTAGTQRIAQTLDALQSAAITRRETLRDTQLELLARDFGAQPNLFVPSDFPVSGPVPTLADLDFAPPSAASQEKARKKNTVRYETRRVLASSESALSGVSVAAQRLGFSDVSPPRATRVLALSPQRRARIASLRARALRETLAWTRLAARRRGWQNVAYLLTGGAAPPDGARDGTGEAARILQLP